MIKNHKHIKLYIIILILGTTVLAFLVGVLSGYHIKKPSTILSPQEYQNKYPFVSTRVFYDNPNDPIISFKVLREELNEYILSDNKKIGIYFEYLPTGTSIGINHDAIFTGASLMKLPYIINTYKQIESENLKMEDEIKIEPFHIDTEWGTLGYTALNKKYKIKDLIHEAIVNSDNTAFNALYYPAGETFPKDLYKELDLTQPRLYDSVVSTDISPREYSKILKSLYYSSYLSFKSSNEILDLLTKIENGEGLRANIPSEIKIAHKIGVKSSNPNPKLNFTSDCGIVYVPKRPYVLCMMSQEDNKIAVEYMKTISSTIYNFVSNKEIKY